MRINRAASAKSPATCKRAGEFWNHKCYKVAQEVKSAGMSGEKVGVSRQNPITFAYCEVAKILLDAFAQAARSVTVLHEQQFRAIVEGDPDAGRFDLLIHEALEQKQNAKYAYINHLESHRCSHPSEDK